MKNIKYIFVLLAILMACTDNFEELNKNPYEITDKSLEQDLNDVGAYFPTLLGNILRPNGGLQVDQNLVSDAFVRHLSTPTPFVANRNNTTYHITWNSYWGFAYSDVMAPVRDVTKIAQKSKKPMFENWAKLLRVMVASRLTAYYGPIIYSNYGSSSKTIDYDDEASLYEAFFKDLDEVLAVFDANKSYTGFNKFDATYSGSVAKWIKMVNSLRLRLAMRIAKKNPSLAKTEAEKALGQAGGLIETNGDNFDISLYDREMPESIICFSWNDTRMSATMESVLVGYKDGRISKFFEPATIDKGEYPNPYKDNAYPYKGIMASCDLKAKALRTSYSTISESFKTAKKRTVISAAEVLFLKAEAALRGWTGAGNAQTNYENAVKASFEQWGAAGASAYLQQDNSNLPIDYVDVVRQPDKSNDFTSRIKVPVKWDSAGNKEKKLEQIITQKWIAFYTNSLEAWVDQRRTGYPKLPYNKRNDSNAEFGVIADDDFIRRMPFVQAEIDNNPDGVKGAVGKLNGGTGVHGGIGAKLYFDTDNLSKATPDNF